MRHCRIMETCKIMDIIAEDYIGEDYAHDVDDAHYFAAGSA